MMHTTRLPVPAQNTVSNDLALHAPHQTSAALGWRCLDILMEMTHQDPDLMEKLVLLGGATSLLVMVSPWLLPHIGITLSGTATATTVLTGFAGSAVSAVAAYAQQYIFTNSSSGAPAYQNQTLYTKDAKAELVVNPGYMPILKISANDHYNAGHIEGTILAPTMHAALRSLITVYNHGRILLRSPQSHDEKGLRKYLEPVLATIPKDYQDEMRGKVDAYNAWLKLHHPKEKPLAYEFYVLLQIQPDMHNYNPFAAACTAIAFRLGDYVVFTRILDWPSFGIADLYLQVERSIKGKKKITDIGFPVVTGLLTAVNEDSLLVEVNVAFGEKIKHPKGLPVLFLNRHCAEHASSVMGIHDILKHHQPLSPYHLTATDGISTHSFHFYQSKEKRGDHVIEKLEESKITPASIAVANPSVYVKKDKVLPHNYKSSEERQKNAIWFLSKQKMPHVTDQKDAATINELKKIAMGVARLALINNCSTTLCAIYVYYKGKLVDASAVTGNRFAAEAPASQYKSLHIP